MKKAGVLVLLVFASFSYFLISSKPVWATPGVWSSNGNLIYYSDGNMSLGANSADAGGFKLQLNGGADGNTKSSLIRLSHGSYSSGNDRFWTIKTLQYGRQEYGSYALEIAQTADIYDGCPGCGGDLVLRPWRNVVVRSTSGVDGKLLVYGQIQAKEVLVTNAAASWPDYVFEDNYSLMSFEELQNYIKDNKHLPNIPNESEVEKNGVSLGEMQKLQMEKIEELTLYILQLKEENEELKMQNEDLKNRIGKVESLFNI